MINIDKNSRVSLDFSPVLEIDISLRPTSDGKVDYAFTLGGLSLFGYHSDLGSEVVRVDFGVFNPIFGFISGLFIRSQLEAECTAVAAIRLRMRMRILTRPDSDSLANFGHQISKKSFELT